MIALLLLAAGAAASAAAAQTIAFDGTYRGIERRLTADIEAVKREHFMSHSGSCFLHPRPSAKLTIKNGMASLPWCLGDCRLEGTVDADGHVILRGFRYGITYIMHVQLYAKGTNPQFDAVGQIDGESCRTVLTWRKVE